MKKKKVAIVTKHPIQYQVPLFKKMNNKNIKIDVFFASRYGLKSNKKDFENPGDMFDMNMGPKVKKTVTINTENNINY